MKIPSHCITAEVVTFYTSSYSPPYWKLVILFVHISRATNRWIFVGHRSNHCGFWTFCLIIWMWKLLSFCCCLLRVCISIIVFIKLYFMHLVFSFAERTLIWISCISFESYLVFFDQLFMRMTWHTPLFLSAFIVCRKGQVICCYARQ